MKLNEAIGLRVKNLLTERGFSQYELNKRGGVPRSTLYDVINAKKKRVSTDTVYQICATMEITMEEFFADPVFTDVPD